MEKLNNKIRSTKADNQFETQSVGVYGYNPALNLQKRIEATDDNHLKVAVASHLVGSPDMAARTDIANDATSTFLKCDVAGVLQVNDVGGGGSTQFNVGDALGATPTGTLILGKDALGDAADVAISNVGEVKTSDADVFAETVTLNATLSNLDTKITSGADTTLTVAQQVLIYGEVTNGVGAGELHPLHISPSGDLQIEIAGLESTGQAAMADSLPVVIASDQSAVATTNASITSGADATLAAAQQVGMYAINAAGAWAQLNLVPETQGLSVNTLERTPTTSSQTISPGAGGTALSNAIDLRGFSRCSLYGNSTNSGDPIEVLISDDDVTYYVDPNIFITPGFSGDFALSLDANIAVRYIKVRQIDTLATAFTLVVKSSRR